MAAKNPWLVPYRQRAAASLRLFCFSYAGGSASIFRNWAQQLPDTIEVCPIELPGRGHRFSEPAATNLDAMIGQILSALQHLLDQPYALFGHSLGAVLAFEIARRQGVAGHPLPRRLFVSGQRSPDRPSPRPPLHLLTDPELIVELQRLGGTPPGVFAEPELLELFLPLLRGDFMLGETFAYPPAQPLACPISAFGGECDPEISEIDIRGWENWTTTHFHLQMFPGDHFFLHRCEPSVVNAVKKDLTM